MRSLRLILVLAALAAAGPLAFVAAAGQAAVSPVAAEAATAAAAAAGAGAAGAGDGGSAVDAGTNIGHILMSWATALLLAVAGLRGLTALGRRDVGEGVTLLVIVVIVGGFVFAPEEVKGLVQSLWSPVGGAGEDAMSAATAELEIRSYGGVFRFERRLYRVDRWRIPLRGGVPLRALLCAPAVAMALALAGRLPLLGALLGLLPAPVHWGLLPLGAIATLTRAQLDGRAAHRVAWSLARWRLQSRWLAGLRRCPPPHGVEHVAGTLAVRPDGRAAATAIDQPAGRLRGPAHVALLAPATLVPTRSPGRLRLAAEPGAPLRRARVLEIPAGAELEL